MIDVADLEVVRTLEAHEIAAILPHAWPFQMIDRVTSLVAGVRATGLKNVSATEGFVPGHFPGRPILPGVFLIEAMAQLSGLVLAFELLERMETDASVTPSGLGYLVSVKHMKFRAPVVPGDQVVVEARKKGSFGLMADFRVRAMVGQEVVAEGSLGLAAA